MGAKVRKKKGRAGVKAKGKSGASGNGGARKAAGRKGAAKKKGAGKKAAKKTKAKKTAKKTGVGESTIALDDLSEVSALVVDAKPVAKKKVVRAKNPRTPTVPRSVKPPPKVADLEMSPEILEFVEAIDAYRQEHCRPFPTWTEVFFVLQRLGYSRG